MAEGERQVAVRRVSLRSAYLCEGNTWFTLFGDNWVMFRRLAYAFLIALLAATPAPALAQRGGNGNGNGNGNGQPPPCGDGRQPDRKNPNCTQIALSIESDIDFGRLVLIGTGVGQVWLDLSTGERFITGGLDTAGGMPVYGRAIITGTPMRAVRVEFPDSITMTDPAGGYATLRNFTTNLSALPILDTTGTLEFRFIGTMFTDQNIQIGGRLRGRVPITVSYD